MTQIRTRVIFILIILLCSAGACSEGPEQGSATAGAEQRQVQQTIDRIYLISGVPPKVGEPGAWDEHARSIIQLGKAAGPHLVEKITDTTETRIGQLFPYKVGDIALALLQEIYRPKSWPFPDGSVELPKQYGDFRDYYLFVQIEGNRERLKQNWRRYIETR